MSDELLRLTEVGVSYGPVQALNEVTLQVKQGEFIALVGANGSGKTTLLQAMHGLLPLSGQRLLTRGSGRQVMVFQRPFLLRLSVWRNVWLALWLAGVPRGERSARVDEALQRVGLASLRGRPARALSGGQQQRLALARAWSLRPAILFLDEPTASLDPSAKQEIETLLAGFKAAGLTLIMSTHNLGQAKRLASRVIYLDRGKIGADLPCADFFKEHGQGARLELFLKGELRWDL
ncbi:ATP-binding cassette domain-containing protein [Paucibacter sp. TC2R-5]|uniref:energy-coupling factor ABC transporter ATP-binding protein n=1 Tax=Paucibacter sp. TC2R-5 TaxID=2893555 RepID=UPI0021E4E867|nr:ATP-binding cassette domain-containing protein [Paucibacter sp. TC2R-5]MCV2357761.1 ATP-binding cassette domain-containing protein [Paucibacter sp. TC2R-5]